MNSKKRITYILPVLITILFLISPVISLADEKSAVKITNQSMIVLPINDTTIQVVQSVYFKNSGSKREDKLSIYLPENYADLQLQQGLKKESIEELNKGIADLTGLDGKSEKQIVISYKMPMFNDTSQWSIEQSYITEQIQVIIQPGVLSFIASDLMTQSDLFEMNGKEFRRFTRLNAHPGEPWTLSFRMMKTSSSEDNEVKSSPVEAKYTEDGLKIIGGAGFGYGKAFVTIIIIIVAMTAALVGLKRDLLKTTGSDRKIARSWLREEKNVLLQEIAQLEKDYRDKLITLNTYENTKSKIRGNLIRITMELE